MIHSLFYPLFFLWPGAYFLALLSPFIFFACPGGNDFLEDFANVVVADLEVVVLQLVKEAERVRISKATSALDSTFFIKN